MGAWRFGSGNWGCASFERSIERKGRGCTKCKSDCNYLIRALVRVIEVAAIRYQFSARRTPFPASLSDLQADH